MNVGEICNREVVVAYKTMTLPEAAKLMREHHVGSRVVTVDRLSERVPVGLLTDRNLTVAALAKEVDGVAHVRLCWSRLLLQAAAAP